MNCPACGSVASPLDNCPRCGEFVPVTVTPKQSWFPDLAPREGLPNAPIYPQKLVAELESLRARLSVNRSQDASSRALIAEQAKRIAELEAVCNMRARQLEAFTVWLDANQPDVWSRGLWSAHNAAVEGEKHEH